LAAIMFTDIVGFSRQMGADEATAVKVIKEKVSLFVGDML
jgi:class 3 adenylate cyclase